MARSSGGQTAQGVASGGEEEGDVYKFLESLVCVRELEGARAGGRGRRVEGPQGWRHVAFSGGWRAVEA